MDAGDAIIGVITVDVTVADGVSYDIVKRHEAVRIFYVWRDVCLEFSSQRVRVAVAGGKVYISVMVHNLFHVPVCFAL